MQNVVIIGGGAGGSAILQILLESEYLQVFGVADINPDAPAMKAAEEIGIRAAEDYREFPVEEVDIVFNVSGDEAVHRDLPDHFSGNTVIIPGSIANVLVQLVTEKEHFISRLSEESHKQNIIFNSIEEGMIGIDHKSRINFINKSAARMIDVDAASAIGRPISELIPLSELPRIYETGRTELNRELALTNGMKIVTSRFPMIGESGEAIGAFAVFKDISEVVSLAEQITDLNEVQTMLQAIIQSSDDAISVVDERGNGILVNPAYTRITGLQVEDVIGKPASADITEGESMHLKVLQTRKPYRGDTYVSAVE